MTTCDQCGELCSNTLTICYDCRQANEEIEEDCAYEDHLKGKCDNNCRYCEREMYE